MGLIWIFLISPHIASCGTIYTWGSHFPLQETHVEMVPRGAIREKPLICHIIPIFLYIYIYIYIYIYRARERERNANHMAYEGFPHFCPMWHNHMWGTHIPLTLSPHVIVPPMQI